MKFRNFLIILLITAVFFTSCDTDSNVTVQPGEFISYNEKAFSTFLVGEERQKLIDILDSVSVLLPFVLPDTGIDELIDKLTDFLNNSDSRRELTDGGVSCGVMEYWTTNQKGALVKASAAVFIPCGSGSSHSLPLFSFQRPTIVHRAESPSEKVQYMKDADSIIEGFGNEIGKGSVAMNLLNLIVADGGYIAVLPDSLGFGINCDVHPYCTNKSADATTDAIRAVKDGMKKHGFSSASAAHPENLDTWNGDRYVMLGYSEGGYVTMNTARAIQKNGGENPKFPVAVACLASPADLSVTMRDLMLTADREFSHPFFLPLTMKSIGAEHLEFPFSRTIVRPAGHEDFPERLFASLSGEYTADEINRIMTETLGSNYHGPATILTEEVKRSLENGGELQRILEKNNAFAGWVPEFPMLLQHDEEDELVPVGNTRRAVEFFSGADDVTVEIGDYHLDLPDVPVHVSASVGIMLDGIKYLDEKVYASGR